jgi:hypothetical protein
VLTAIPVVLALMLQAHLSVSPGLVVVIGLGVFGFVFAVISSLHSYLILVYAGSKKAAEDVGFYCLLRVVPGRRRPGASDWRVEAHNFDILQNIH